MALNRNQLDKLLISQIKQGDKAAFKRFYVYYFESLLRFCWRYVKSVSEAENIVQEVFADIWDDNRSWNPKRSVKVYLYQAVKNRAFDHLDHVKTRNSNEEKWMAYQLTENETEADHRVNNLIRESVGRAVANLPDRCRMIYKLHRKDGLTYQEIADVMEISIKTVESQMSRALQKLREELREYDFAFLYIHNE
jgi:RNA polymerase sigma-70 factor (ECF subfamily)